jgi:small subunit ribosomal protein S1
LDKLIGQTYQFKVIKFNKKRGNIVLSRRVLLEKERDEQKTKTLETLEEGKVVRGVIKNITEYGAFVDLGGIDGLSTSPTCPGAASTTRASLQGRRRGHGQGPQVQRRDRARLPRPQADPGRSLEPRRRGVPAGQEGARQGHVDHRLRRVRRARAGRRGPHPRQRDELDQEGQAPVEAARGRAGDRLPGARGRRQGQAHLARSQAARADPWTLFTEKYSPGDKIGGKVRSITDYGVFIGIEEGVDGMVHKSDLSWTAKVNNPADLHHKGDDVEAIILSINHDEKKVSLGISSSGTILADHLQRVPSRARSSTRRSFRSSTTAVRPHPRGCGRLIPTNEIHARRSVEGGEPSVRRR